MSTPKANTRFLDISTLPGRYFVFEGLDGSGKSTQCQKLVAHFQQQGHTVLHTREPTDSPFGTQLRSLAAQGQRLPPQQELELFIQDRKAHLQQCVLPALQQGQIVIQDRYFPSTLAYQGSRGLPLQDMLDAHQGWAPLPHHFFYLQLSAQQSQQRIQQRNITRDAFEQYASLQRCAQIFAQLQLPNWHIIPATQSVEQVHQQTIRALKEPSSLDHL
ncbi:MAG: dTMP kinase [Myxococcota bacterium]